MKERLTLNANAISGEKLDELIRDASEAAQDVQIRDENGNVEQNVKNQTQEGGAVR